MSERNPMKDVETFTILVKAEREQLMLTLERLAEYAESLRKACDDARQHFRG